MPGQDLGTYHVRVDVGNGRGWIATWHTGRRFTAGTPTVHPLSAVMIAPTWENEEELFSAILYAYTAGNYGCDCNKLLAMAHAAHEDVDGGVPCGETLPLVRLTVIRPDGTSVELPIDAEAR